MVFSVILISYHYTILTHTKIIYIFVIIRYKIAFKKELFNNNFTFLLVKKAHKNRWWSPSRNLKLSKFGFCLTIANRISSILFRKSISLFLFYTHTTFIFFVIHNHSNSLVITEQTNRRRRYSAHTPTPPHTHTLLR